MYICLIKLTNKNKNMITKELLTEIAKSIYLEFTSDQENQEFSDYEICQEKYTIYFSGQSCINAKEWTEYYTDPDCSEEMGEYFLENVDLKDLTICFNDDNETQINFKNKDLLNVQYKIYDLCKN